MKRLIKLITADKNREEIYVNINNVLFFKRVSCDSYSSNTEITLIDGTKICVLGDTSNIEMQIEE